MSRAYVAIAVADVGPTSLRQEAEAAMARGEEVACARVPHDDPNWVATVVYLPAVDRAGIASNGDATWYDAFSVDEAIAKWDAGEPAE